MSQEEGAIEKRHEKNLSRLSEVMSRRLEKFEADIEEKLKELGDVTDDCLTSEEMGSYPMLSSNRLKHITQCTCCTKVTGLMNPKRGGTYE